MNEVKKARLIWKEKIPDGTDAIPMLSFDNGINWISLEKSIKELKSGTLNIDFGSSITKIDGEWNSIDLSVPFAPETVPYLSDATTLVQVNKNLVTDYLDHGTYYVAISANTNDSVGFQDINDNKTNFDLNISKLYKITIPETAIDAVEKYVIDLFVQYPDYINGICIYLGKDNIISEENIDNTGQIALDLIYVSNLSGILADNYNTSLSNQIKLKNSQNFPKSGIIQIGSHFVEYDGKSYDFTNPSNQLTILTVKRRITMGDSSIIYLSSNNIIVKLKDFNIGDTYSALPPKVFPIIEDKNNLSIYLPFDNKNLTDLGKNNKSIIDLEAVVIKNNINQVLTDTVNNYSNKTPKITGNSINMNGSFIIDPRIKLTDECGSVLFYFMIDKNPPQDTCLFGNKEGLGIFLSSITLKPYIKVNNEIKTNIYDSRMDTVSINTWYRYGVTWTTTGTIKNIMFYIDGYLALTLTMDSSDFEKDLFIGGINTNTGYSNIFSGNIDDFRVYTIDKDISVINRIHRELLNNQNKYSGKIRISKRMDLNESLQATDLSSPTPTINFSTLTGDEPDFPRLYNSSDVVVYKNGVKLIKDTDYTLSEKIVTLSTGITNIDIVKVYSNEINKYFPATFIPQINVKSLFDEIQGDKNICVTPYQCFTKTTSLDDSPYVEFSDEESENFTNKQIFFIRINTSGDNWEYINNYLYSHVDKKITFSNVDYAGKIIEIYTDTQIGILSGFSTRLLLIGESLDNIRVANSLNTSSLKLKFDLSSNSIFSTPEIKDLGVIISKFNLQ
ncbi:MAG: hypothetical protein EOL97_12835 [Spirochaetia bacterium]|nr:hypothetical protein [Spirochaetia bacterium]